MSGGRGKGWENSQTDSLLSVEPSVGLSPRTLRSWSEPKSRASLFNRLCHQVPHSSVFLVSVIDFFISDCSFLYFLFVEDFFEILNSFLKSSEYIYDHYFEIFIRYIAFLHLKFFCCDFILFFHTHTYRPFSLRMFLRFIHAIVCITLHTSFHHMAK